MSSDHQRLSDPPACTCGWVPRSSDPYRGALAVNQHIGRERAKTARQSAGSRQ